MYIIKLSLFSLTIAHLVYVNPIYVEQEYNVKKLYKETQDPVNYFALHLLGENCTAGADSNDTSLCSLCHIMKLIDWIKCDKAELLGDMIDVTKSSHAGVFVIAFALFHKLCDVNGSSDVALLYDLKNIEGNSSDMANYTLDELRISSSSEIHNPKIRNTQIYNPETLTAFLKEKTFLMESMHNLSTLLLKGNHDGAFIDLYYSVLLLSEMNHITTVLFSRNNESMNITNDSIVTTSDIIPKRIRTRHDHDSSNSAFPTDSSHKDHESTIFNWKGFLVAIGTTIIIILLGFTGLGFILLKKRRKLYFLTLQFFFALSFSCLIGDVVFHLLPSVLSLHDHEHHHYDATHNNILQPPSISTNASGPQLNGHNHHLLANDSYIWKFFPLIGGIVIFYVVENVIHLCPRMKGHQCGNSHGKSLLHEEKSTAINAHVGEHHHQPSHDTSSSHHKKQVLHINGSCDHGSVTHHAKSNSCVLSSHASDLDDDVDQSNKVTENNPKKCKNFSHIITYHHSPNIGPTSEPSHTHDEKVHITHVDSGMACEYTSCKLPQKQETSPTPDHQKLDCKKNLQNLVVMLLISDGLHHLLDGVALGSTFSMKGSVAYHHGFSTAIAIACHELPHNLGDIAILIQQGYSEIKSTLYVMLSSSVAIIGVLIGSLLVSLTKSIGLWMDSFIAGMFLYLGLTMVIPQLADNFKSTHQPKLHTLGAQVLGFLLGFSIMFAIVVLEERM